MLLRWSRVPLCRRYGAGKIAPYSELHCSSSTHLWNHSECVPMYRYGSKLNRPQCIQNTIHIFNYFNYFVGIVLKEQTVHNVDI